MRGTSQRRIMELYKVQPTPDSRRYQMKGRRDSDASFASSLPSATSSCRSFTVEFLADRAHQAIAVRSINTFLTSRSSHAFLRTHPISSSKEITETIQFLLNQLDYPCVNLEDDLFVVLKNLNCPIKVNKSALRASNSPHNWPSFLATMQWLMQIAAYKQYLEENSGSLVESNSMLAYAFESYSKYIRGDDESVERLDKEFSGKIEQEKNNVIENVRELKVEWEKLEAKCEAMRNGPSEREKLEREKSVLEEDMSKFHAIISEFNQRIEAVEAVLVEKKKELEAKVVAKKGIDDENEELKKSVEKQNLNVRDADRMKRELQVVERDVAEAESARNTWEEKTWDLDGAVALKLKELEALAMECNQEARRLKLGESFQFTLNSKGSAPAEVMGIDYKSTFKRGLESFSESIKNGSMEKLEELISLQQESSELTTKIDNKKSSLATVQSHVEDVESQIDLMRKEMDDFTCRFTSEGKQMVQVFEIEDHDLVILESQAVQLLKGTEMKMQERMIKSEDVVQSHARQLLAVVDDVSKYKEHVTSKISALSDKLTQTSLSVSQAYQQPSSQACQQPSSQAYQQPSSQAYQQPSSQAYQQPS